MGITANYSMAVASTFTLPIACKVRYSIIFTIFAFILGIVSVGCNIALIVLLMIRSGKHVGGCYLRQDFQWYLIALSALEIFLMIDILCYLPAIRSRIRNERIVKEMVRNNQ